MAKTVTKNRRLVVPVASTIAGGAKWIHLSRGGGNVYRKEVVTEGSYGKLNNRGKGLEFDVFKDTLEHWKASVEDFKEHGIPIPLSKSHSNWDAIENKLGDVVNALIKRNKKGKRALYLDFTFVNEKAKRLALAGDVSIGSPDVWHDGLKRKHIYPVQHVAATAGPVVPGLEKWQAIAAAHNSEGKTMEVDDIIALMGITVEDGSSDDVKWALIKAKLTEDYGSSDEEVVDEEAGDVAASGPGKVKKPIVNRDDEDDADESKPKGGKAGKKTMQATVTFSHENPLARAAVNTETRRVKAVIEGLQDRKVISAAVAKDLQDQYTDSDAMYLALSHDEDLGEAFDREVARLEKNSKIKPLEKTGRRSTSDDDGVEFSHGEGSDDFVKYCEGLAKQR